MTTLPMHVTPIGGHAMLVEPADALDPATPDRYLEALGLVLQHHGARTLFYDLRHVLVIDRVYYNWLTAVRRACAMLGVEFVLLHIRPATAYALTRILAEPAPFRCVAEVEYL